VLVISAVAAESMLGPVLILIALVGVISTAQTCKPAASTPSMARTMSAGVKRRILRLVFRLCCVYADAPHSMAASCGNGNP
jgi:hypothetical protein